MDDFQLFSCVSRMSNVFWFIFPPILFYVYVASMSGREYASDQFYSGQMRPLRTRTWKFSNVYDFRQSWIRSKIYVLFLCASSFFLLASLLPSEQINYFTAADIKSILDYCNMFCSVFCFCVYCRSAGRLVSTGMEKKNKNTEELNFCFSQRTHVRAGAADGEEKQERGKYCRCPIWN